jgi:hypothetical protein
MTMSAFVKLLIVGWLTTFLMIWICALNESGALLMFSRRLTDWLAQLSPRLPSQREERSSRNSSYSCHVAK